MRGVEQEQTVMGGVRGPYRAGTHPSFTHCLMLMTPHDLPQGTTNQHLPHVHEQLLVGWIVGASSDDGDEGDDECNLAPSTTTKITRPWHQTPPLQATAHKE